MVCEITKEKSPLLPLRHQQGDFFVCDIFDAVPKGDMASMEHPIFSLSTKPDFQTRKYRNGPIFLTIRPGSDGLATVHDRDILIYCISQIMAALNRGRPVSKSLRFNAIDLLMATNRTTAGNGYLGLKAALQRLQSTQFETNILTGGKEHMDMFSLIDRVRIVRETREGRMQEIEITLSDWMFDAIESKEVLTLNKRYFQLRKPLERRLYELARKHCGRQRKWVIGLELLHKKTGSTSTMKEFRRLISKIIADDMTHGHMPDYAYSLLGDKIKVHPKKEFTALSENNRKNSVGAFIALRPDTFEKARKIAPGWDVYSLESEWRGWIKTPPDNPDAAFLGFCKKWKETRGTAK